MKYLKIKTFTAFEYFNDVYVFGQDNYSYL